MVADYLRGLGLAGATIGIEETVRFFAADGEELAELVERGG